MDMSNKLTKKEYEKMLSSKETETEREIEAMSKVIKNKTARKQSVSFLKALDGKKIRNTPGT